MKFYDMDILRDFIKYASDSSLRERERTMFPAESFVSGRKTGVVVWNISEDTPLEFKVSVPARKLVLANRRKTPLCHPRLTGMFWHLKASPSLCLNSLILKII